ncbi:NADH-quinone oxidoreductase subunit J [Psychrobacter cryohalolentis]|uniref:NADH-quinone oxidoreductase subunit J n=1 Tax=Psychrobacter cryohalolentis (strain ATCC BAA-1226 / DSM 17306 / VKM B-2378 / K5) TaxID=335284 RepID=Q1QD89_PSYCK|nr:NADH-quinone oxidoreductase subunit J [Psychrobacter cryohalolentis]ABE74364.1 NADH dehydrogenase subunit J [Psychrobacter cryohalolentis K5]ASE26994.1 NADH-quinone oxidoreductase subunit J [Psychrobacter cryohalolentis]
MMNILNNPELAGFYSLAAVAIFASLRVVTQANPVHAILSMIVSLLAIAGIFFVIGAPFAGALEIVVYAGAIMVLFVFVIMMLNLGMRNDEREERWLDAGTWAIPTGLTIIIAVVLYAMIGLNHNEAALIGGTTISAKAVGTVLFTKYIMLIEVAALLLLAALVAAYHLGKEAIDDEIIGNDSLVASPNVGSIELYENDSMHTNNDVVKMAKPYEYKDVDPHDYVGMKVGMKAGTQNGMKKVTRKESD